MNFLYGVLSFRFLEFHFQYSISLFWSQAMLVFAGLITVKTRGTESHYLYF